jgi:hypothetical protein
MGEVEMQVAGGSWDVRHLEMGMRLVVSISIRGVDGCGTLGRHYGLEPIDRQLTVQACARTCLRLHAHTRCERSLGNNLISISRYSC